MTHSIELIEDTETLALAQALIKNPSVSPKDAGCQALMIQRLAAMGFDITPMPFADVENFWPSKTVAYRVQPWFLPATPTWSQQDP